MLVASVGVVVSCVTMKDPWVGQTQDQVVAKYGSPDSKTADGQGGQVWVYLETVYFTRPTMTSHGPSNELDSYLLVRQFWFDASGIVYNHREQQR